MEEIRSRNRKSSCVRKVPPVPTGLAPFREGLDGTDALILAGWGGVGVGAGGSKELVRWMREGGDMVFAMKANERMPSGGLGWDGAVLEGGRRELRSVN